MSKYCGKCGSKVKNNFNGMLICKKCNNDMTNYENYANEGIIFGVLSLILLLPGLLAFSILASLFGISRSSLARKNLNYTQKSNIGLGISIISMVITLLIILIRIF